jgi:hypothetical protein
VGLLDDRGGEDTYDTVDPVVGQRSDGSTWLDGPGVGIGLDE